MFIKIGDLNPISVVHPADVDDESVKKSLKKVIKNVKDNKKDSMPDKKVENV
jgi:hypothetical protein